MSKIASLNHSAWVNTFTTVKANTLKHASFNIAHPSNILCQRFYRHDISQFDIIKITALMWFVIPKIYGLNHTELDKFYLNIGRTFFDKYRYTCLFKSPLQFPEHHYGRFVFVLLSLLVFFRPSSVNGRHHHNMIWFTVILVVCLCMLMFYK